MKTASFPIPGPADGVVRRLTAFMRNATSDSHPFLVKLAGKLGITTGAQDRHQAVTPQVPSRPNAAPPAAQSPADILTTEDRAVLEGWDAQLKSMTEPERDAFVTALAAQVQGTVKEEPPLTLDQQFAALTTPEQRSEFLKANSKIILAH